MAVLSLSAIRPKPASRSHPADSKEDHRRTSNHPLSSAYGFETCERSCLLHPNQRPRPSGDKLDLIGSVWVVKAQSY